MKKKNQTQISNKAQLFKKKKNVYPDTGILFSLKEEGNPVTCYNMDEP